MSGLIQWKRQKKLNTKIDKAEAGQRREGNLLGGQANWKAHVLLQIRQAFRVHSLWGTWPKSKWDIESPTTRQNKKTDRKKKNPYLSRAAQLAQTAAEGKVSRQPLLSDDYWIWRDIHKEQLKKQRLLEWQQTPPSGKGTGQSTYFPVFSRTLKTRIILRGQETSKSIWILSLFPNPANSGNDAVQADFCAVQLGFSRSLFYWHAWRIHCCVLAAGGLSESHMNSGSLTLS